MVKKNVYLALLAAAFILLTNTALMAQSPGDLLVAPTRVILTDRQRTGELILLNTGNASATYRITFTHMRMTETGAIEEVTTPLPTEMFCDDLVRFTPRQITLEPKVSQTIRLQLRLPAELAEGEYRSHLLFKAIPQETPARNSKNADSKPEGVSIRLTAIYGISIPVIVRHGQTSATATLTDLHVKADPAEKNAPVLTATISREGNQSIYGDLIVTFSRDSSRTAILAKIGGVAVYTPNPRRVVKLLLTPPKGVDVKSGRVTLTFKQKEADGGKVIAEAYLDVP